MLFSRRQSEEEKRIALCYDYAAKVLTEINSIAEEAVLRYGVRYSSTSPPSPRPLRHIGQLLNPDIDPFNPDAGW